MNPIHAGIAEHRVGILADGRLDGAFRLHALLVHLPVERGQRGQALQETESPFIIIIRFTIISSSYFNDILFRGYPIKRHLKWTATHLQLHVTLDKVFVAHGKDEAQGRRFEALSARDQRIVGPQQLRVGQLSVYVPAELGGRFRAAR